VSSRDQTIKTLFEGLPEKPETRLKAIAAIYSQIRKEAAKHLQPTISTLLEKAHEFDFDQKVQFAHDVGEILLDARLAIQDPETGLAAGLRPVRPRPSSMASRFYLRDTRNSPDGERHEISINEAFNFKVRLISTTGDSVKQDVRNPRGGRGR
jgi:hypothetical protein